MKGFERRHDEMHRLSQRGKPFLQEGQP